MIFSCPVFKLMQMALIIVILRCRNFCAAYGAPDSRANAAGSSVTSSAQSVLALPLAVSSSTLASQPGPSGGGVTMSTTLVAAPNTGGSGGPVRRPPLLPPPSLGVGFARGWYRGRGTFVRGRGRGGSGWRGRGFGGFRGQGGLDSGQARGRGRGGRGQGGCGRPSPYPSSVVSCIIVVFWVKLNFSVVPSSRGEHINWSGSSIIGGPMLITRLVYYSYC